MTSNPSRIALALGLFLGTSVASAIECRYFQSSGPAVQISSAGDDTTVTMMGREGATLQIARDMQLPDANLSYRYVSASSVFPTANCRISKEDRNVITCDRMAGSNLSFGFPHHQQAGKGSSFRIVHRREFDADGKSIDTHDFQFQIYFPNPNGGESIATQTIRGLECV